MIKTLGICIVDASVTPQQVDTGASIVIAADVRDRERCLVTHEGQHVVTHGGQHIKVRIPPALLVRDQKVLVTHEGKIIRVRKE